MRGPLKAVWNTRILGTSLRAYVAFLLAGLLAVAGAAVLRVGGMAGVVALSAVLVVGFGTCWVALTFR